MSMFAPMDPTAQGFMLAEDVERAVAAAARWGAGRHVVRLPVKRETRSS